MKKISANKQLGQHFLINKHVAISMTEDFAKEAEAIIEIGPGKGVLTEYLVNWNLPFHVIEKDDRMIEPLNQIIAFDQITLSDVLELHLEDWLSKIHFEDKKIWVISNLPYNISVPILMKLIKIPAFKYMTLMFQKEVAEKIFNYNNKRNAMNSLMGICQNYFEMKLLCKVHPGSFSPPPKVESTVISFVRYHHPQIPLNEFDSLEQFLRRLYQFKRKQMGGILKKYYPLDKLVDTFNSIGKDSTDRAEALEFEQLISMYKRLKCIQ